MTTLGPLEVVANAADGIIYNTSAAAWATARAAASGTAYDNGADMQIAVDFVTPNYQISRGFEAFDFSGFPAGDVVDSAFVTLTRKGNIIGSVGDLFLCASTPANKSDISGGDFDQVGDTKFTGAITFAAADTPTDFALTPAGLAYLAAGAVISFGIRAKADIENSAPGADQGCFLHSKEASTAAYRPKFTVVHHTPGQPIAGSASVGLAGEGAIRAKNPLAGSSTFNLQGIGASAAKNPLGGSGTLGVTSVGDIEIKNPLSGVGLLTFVGSGSITALIPSEPIAGSATLDFAGFGEAAAKNPLSGGATLGFVGSGAATAKNPVGGIASLELSGSGAAIAKNPIGGSWSFGITANGVLTAANPLGGSGLLTLQGSGLIDVDNPVTQPIGGSATVDFVGHGAVGATNPLSGAGGLGFVGSGALSAVNQIGGFSSIAFSGSGSGRSSRRPLKVHSSADKITRGVVRVVIRSSVTRRR